MLTEILSVQSTFFETNLVSLGCFVCSKVDEFLPYTQYVDLGIFSQPDALRHGVVEPPTLNPQPSIPNPQPSTLNLQPSTLNPQPSTPNPELSSGDPCFPTPAPPSVCFAPSLSLFLSLSLSLFIRFLRS